MIRLLLPTILFALLLTPTTSPAAPDEAKKEDAIPTGALYRYRTGAGQMVVSSTLPREAIQAGYEIIDRNGQVIREVAPAPTEADRERAARERRRKEEQRRQEKEDKRLLRLYAGPEDARRARDRQLEALRLNISYTRNNMQQVKGKLSGEVSAAARYERQGKEVPEAILANINRFQRQLKDLEMEISEYEQDMAQIRAEFAPIIERLRVLTGDDSNASAQSAPEDQAAE